MAYTLEQLSVVCPKCIAGKGGKCLERNKGGMGGMHYVEEAHAERISLALSERTIDGC